MLPRAKHGLLVSIIVGVLVLGFLTSSNAQSITYVYDNLNRLIQIRYNDGTGVDYFYDDVGNRIGDLTGVPCYDGNNIKVGDRWCASLQEAYGWAVDGDTIKCFRSRFIGNLTVNQNKTVTLEGGYDCSFITNTGQTSTLKGMITTNSGTIIIKNFILEQ